MRIFTLAFLLFLAFGLNAQTPISWLLRSDTSYFDHGVFVSANANGEWASNVLDNEWAKNMVIGGYFGGDQELALLKKMSPRNRIGAFGSGDIQFYNGKDSVFHQDKWGIQAGLGVVFNGYAGFTNDMFELVYIGNNNHLGDTLNLGPSYFNYQAFKKFGVGIFNKKNLSGFKLNLVMGQDFQDYQLRKGEMYTAPDGESITLNYLGEFWQADTTKKGFVANKGIGLSFDGDFNLPLSNNSGFISVSVRDFGWVNWSSLTNHYYVDSTLTWTGVDINNIDSLSSNFALPNWADTLGIERDQRSKWSALPAWFHLRILKKWNNKNAYFAGISLQPNFVSIPMGYFGLNQKVGKGWMMSEQIAYGGYGSFRLGVEAQYFIQDKFYLRFGSADLFGYFSEWNKGMSGFVGLGVHIN